MFSLKLFFVLGTVVVVQSAEPIRVVLVYETNNGDADRAFSAVQSYLERTKIPGLSLGNVSRVVLDSTQKYLTVDDVCSVYDKSIENETPPHLVLDLTWSGLSSEVMKALTRNLGLPTISGSYGGIGDIKHWSSIDANQSKYLIQVMPPSDIISQLVALSSSLQNMTNAAILYDDTFGRLNFKMSRLESKTALGVWKAGIPGAISFAPGQSLRPFRVVSVYKIAVVVQAPFIMKRRINGTVEFYGYCVDLIKDIQAIMGFEYELYEVPDGKYGNMDSKMNWNGMIKELMEKRADIGLGALAVMAERENVIDFTVPYYDLVGISILMAQPQVSTSLFKFLTVLENDVWGCILAAYFFTSILLWIFDRWSPYSYQNNKEKYADDPEEEKREFSLKESLWFCMTSLTPQGGGESPKHLSGRLIAATWWLFGFIIIASYTANLAAFLTVSRLDSPVNSLDDLASQYKVQYAPQNGTDVATYFERMAYIEKRFYEIWKDMSLNDSMSEVERSKLAVWDYPVSDKYTKIWQSMQDAGLPQTFDEALTRVRASNAENNDGFAFLGDATDIRYQVLVNCDLQMVGEEFSRKPYAVAVQEGSPLRDLLNDAILRLLNQRRLETLKERWWTDNPEKKDCGDTNDQSDGISIQNIGGVFIVIFVGIFLACVTLAIEYCYFKFRRHPDADDGVSATDSSNSNVRNKLDDVYGKNSQQPYVLESMSRNNKQVTNAEYGGEFGYYGAKREAELEGDGPRPRKAW